MAHHLSIFVENHPGKLNKITAILGEHHINIRAMTLASGGEFGVLKVLVDDPDKGYDVLKENHMIVSKRFIIVAKIDDRPGSLHRLLALLSNNQINIEDCYGFILENSKHAAVVLEVQKFPEAENILLQNKIDILEDRQIYTL